MIRIRVSQAPTWPPRHSRARGNPDAQVIARGDTSEVLDSRLRGNDGAPDQNGFTITRITISVAASAGTSFIIRSALFDTDARPFASFLA